MTKPIPPLDLSWLLIESPAGTTHVGAMLLFKKPPGRTPIVREIVEAYRACSPAPPFNCVPELLGRGAPHFREVTSWDPYSTSGTWLSRSSILRRPVATRRRSARATTRP